MDNLAFVLAGPFTEGVMWAPSLSQMVALGEV